MGYMNSGKFKFLLQNAGYWLLCCLGVMLLSVACQDTTAQRLANAKLKNSCLINSNCEEPLVCAFKTCHVQCESSRDCQDGARCVVSDKPYKVCQFDEDVACEGANDCPDPLICGVDGECRNQCILDAQCTGDQVCVSGACAEPAELNSDGQLEAATGHVAGEEGTPCTYASDCKDALLCRNSSCLPECVTDKDCGSGKSCDGSRCVASGTSNTAASCFYNSQCKVADGELCASGYCRCECVEDRDCPSGMECDGCACKLPVDSSSCILNSQCSAGERCFSGVCGPECAKDVDCPTNWECAGGTCQVKISGGGSVIVGGYTVEDSISLDRLSGVEKITGTLTIRGGALTQLDALSSLTSVGGLELSDLSSINNLNGLKNLATVTNIDIRGELKAGTLELPKVPKLTLLSVDSSSVKSIVLAELTQLNSLTLANASLLMNFSAPKLGSLKTLNINAVSLTNLDFIDPTVNTALAASFLNEVNIEGISALGSCYFTALQASWATASTLTATASVAIIPGSTCAGSCTGKVCNP